jgi:hypothetical protein
MLDESCVQSIHEGKVGTFDDLIDCVHAPTFFRGCLMMVKLRRTHVNYLLSAALIKANFSIGFIVLSARRDATDALD